MVNTKKFLSNLMVVTKTDDLREAIQSLHNWGYNQDFTARDGFDDPIKYLRAFAIAQLFDLDIPVYSITELKEILRVDGEPFSSEERDQIYKLWELLGVR